MNIHLLSDEKFIDNFITNWEKYQSNNIYVVVSQTSNLKFINIHRDKIELIPPHKDHFNAFINKLSHFENLIIHSLSGIKLLLAEEILKHFNPKVFWIYFGNELYSYLEKRNVLNLYDYRVKNRDSFLIKVKKHFYPHFNILKTGEKYKKPSIKEFAKKVDYFCFWNPFDFELVKKYLNQNLKYKFFIYFMSSINDYKKFYNPTFENKILVNNSSSKFGNHLTILKKLNRLNIHSFDLLIPLSYGDKSHKDRITKYIRKEYNFKAEIVTEYLDLQQYSLKIAKSKVAIFGAKRQHAGGNIFFMVGIGAKVFLRPENSIYQYLLDRGAHIFNFDNDLNSVDDLKELTLEQKEHNHHLILKEFSDDTELVAYKNFFVHA